MDNLKRRIAHIFIQQPCYSQKLFGYFLVMVSYYGVMASHTEQPLLHTSTKEFRGKIVLIKSQTFLTGESFTVENNK